MTKQQQQLIEDNINLVYYTIRRYYPNYINDDDIVQSGMLGLCKAVKTWNDEKNCTFSSCCIQYIRNHILLEFRKRDKHASNYSLDYEYADDDGEPLTLADFVVGEKDVDFVDMRYLYSKLTTGQQKIFELKRTGLKNVEIAKIVKLTPERVRQQVRRIEYKLKMFMEE